MDSPYRPGFGARPTVLVGRDRQLARASAALTRVANSRSPAPSALVLTGARGMGKTVTLGVVAERGRERGFVTAGVALDSVSDNVQLIATRVAESLKDFENRGGRRAWERVRDRLAALSLEVKAGGVTSPPTRDRAATQSAAQREALAALLADGHGSRRAGSSSRCRALPSSSAPRPTRPGTGCQEPLPTPYSRPALAVSCRRETDRSCPRTPTAGCFTTWSTAATPPSPKASSAYLERDVDTRPARRLARRHRPSLSHLPASRSVHLSPAIGDTCGTGCVRARSNLVPAALSTTV